ncbi:MAG: Panacea domain-containing protein [Dehalogenimonas sp.]
MPQTYYRNKLLNSVLFFANQTKNLNLTKLQKLLFFLDFTHFRDVGYPCIGLKYYAFENGPVAKDFWAEIKDGEVPSDFSNKIAFLKKQFENKPGYELQIKAIAKPDMSVFSPREQKILEYLSDVFRDAKAWQISLVSHMPNDPWDITRKNRGPNQEIDYCLSIDKENLEESSETLKEYFEILNNFELGPTKD